MKVKRSDLNTSSLPGTMRAAFMGDYVLHLDYAALEAKLERMTEALVRIIPQAGNWQEVEAIARAALTASTTENGG